MKEADAQKALDEAWEWALERLLEMDYGRVVLDFKIHQGDIRLLMTHEVSSKGKAETI